MRINEIQSFATLDRNVVIGVMGLIALCMLGLAAYLRRVVRDLGADPAELKQVAVAVARGDLAAPIQLRAGDTDSIMAALATMSSRLSSSVQTVRRNAESVAAASGQIARKGSPTPQARG